MANKERYWNIDDIQPLPKRLYKKFYGKDYSDDWKLRFRGLSESEKKSLEPILKSQKFKEVYWVPEVISPMKKVSSDLYIDQQKVEIKKVTTATSTDTQLRKASKQINGNGWIIVDTSESKLSIREIKTIADKRGLRESISKYAIVKNGELKDIRKLTVKKEAPVSLTQGVNEQVASYTSILSPNPKKVNSKIQKPSMATIKADDYWVKRSTERMSNAESLSISHLKQVQKEYKATAKDVVEQVRDLYATYYRKSGNTFDLESLKQIAPQGDVKRFLASMEAKGLSTQLPSNYQGRMSRLELLNGQMWGKVKEMATKERVATTDLYDKVFRSTYYQTGYDTSKGLGESLAFGTLDDKTVDKVLGSKFYGRNYSERIWGNTDKLAEQLQSIVSQAIATGQSPEKTARLIRERFNVSQSNAARLVRTETCYFENQAEIEAYEEMGISEYVILATLDSRTSKICREMDGKRFKVKDAVAGRTLPPLHPYCRTAIRPYIGVDFEPKTRIMRDPETGKNKTIDQITFDEWKQKYLVEPKRNQKVAKKRVLVGSASQKTTKPKSNNSIENTLNEEQLAEYNRLLSAHGPEKVLYETYADSVHIEDANFAGTAHYSPATNSLKFNLAKDSKAKFGDDTYRTLFHESGHNIDAVSNGVYNPKPFSAEYKDGIFPKTLKEEVRAYTKRLLDEGKKINPNLRMENAYMALTQEVRKYNSKDRAYASDIFSGTTRNKVKVGAYHSTQYWSRGGDNILATEAFAQMYSATILNSNAVEIIKKYFPKSYSIYRDMIKEMTKRGKNGNI